MGYSVKSIFYTLQGEGSRSGWPAVFCRFSGCNLWNGVETDRAKATCWFCDTDFVGTDGENGGYFGSASELSARIAAQWPSNKVRPYVVFTGGEPMLQLNEELIASVKELGFTVAIETNGTKAVPKSVDWVTVSPKPNTKLVQTTGNEVKLVYPHEIAPEELSALDFDYHYLSPLWVDDEKKRQEHLNSAIKYVLAHPEWKLTSQMHKMWSIP